MAEFPSVAWFYLLAIVIYQAVILSRDGQSIGKKALTISIVKVDTGKNGGFVPNVLLRLVVNGLLAFIPLYIFIDILFIFRSDRRCIHDFIAGTKVVDDKQRFMQFI
ncbi:MAG: RDD family protein [Proteobacteria bacterium]|nr:RDD family protein [Pseudomonadota bacterium]